MRLRRVLSCVNSSASLSSAQMSGSSPPRSPITRTLTPSRCSVARSLRMKRRKRPNRSPISLAGRDQFSEEKEKMVRYRMPSSCEAATTRRSASTPRRGPSARGSPREAAQRPLPSMMMATCNGPSDRSGSRLAGAAFDIADPLSIPLDGEDFFFLGRQQLVDLRDHTVGRLLHVVGETLLIVLGDLVVLLELLDDVEPVAAHMAHGDLGGLGVFVRDLYELLATLLVELGDAQAQHLAFGRRRQA